MKKEVRAEIIAIGDELLYGQIQDTNSHWISQELTQIGVRVVRRTTVGDNQEAILSAFALAEKNADIILMTGGLGPTQDDLTKQLLATYFDCTLELVPEALDAVRVFFERRGRELTETNKLQAHLPTKCTYVPNEVGTAPGMWFEEKGCVWMSMPGVPHEMRKLMTDFVLPKLKSLYDLPVIYHQLIRTVGIGESWLSDLIKDWEDALPENVKLAYLPSLGEVKLRLTAFADDMGAASGAVARQLDLLKPMIEKYIYAYGNIPMHEAIGSLLNEKNQKVAFAESCSGGYIAHLVTSVAGASAYFQGGIIPYHNTYKQTLLGVSDDTLSSHGAVSEQTVIEMAKGVREKFQTDYGVASSGIAGPSGGTADKPVGTVWIACSYQGGVDTKLLQLTQDRSINIHLTAISALNLLRTCILRETS
ncbi:MAG: competence/damage-inducible protein A [Lunatimonas sp.]|uniref:competence/damage-inducible protein A n=1 Tax=Lunatimonas sp. TaxID=2060141 RepID=UPI00263BAA68|nr:competence/damage-inducible protein A [Lunatimonas sp.]MCC5935649.1 competence/damage-inducible protein A [Lunatimonas sp.]